MAINFDESAVRVLLTAPDGPVGRDLSRRVLNVHAEATRNCPVDTGRLRSSLRWSIAQDGRGLVGLVGSDVDYAIYVHEGTRYLAARPFLLDALNTAGAA